MGKRSLPVMHSGYTTSKQKTLAHATQKPAETIKAVAIDFVAAWWQPWYKWLMLLVATIKVDNMDTVATCGLRTLLVSRIIPNILA